MVTGMASIHGYQQKIQYKKRVLGLLVNEQFDDMILQTSIITGAKPIEVITMNASTVNIHMAMVQQSHDYHMTQ